MLGHSYFYRNLIRTYVVAFGSLFKNIEIRDWDDEDEAWTDRVLVPVSYGSKEKHIARVEAREETNEGAAITLPRIAFVISGLSYDTTRVLNKMNRISGLSSTSTNRMAAIGAGVPYDITFSLSILTKKTEDGTKILEQILPFFTPNMNVSLKLKYNNVNSDSTDSVVLDVPITLNSVSLDDVYDGDFISRKTITWDLEFTMKAKFLGPVGDRGGVIKTAITNLGVGEVTSDLIESITVIPTVDGKTLDEIVVTDEYNFLETIEYIGYE